MEINPLILQTYINSTCSDFGEGGGKVVKWFTSLA